MLEKKIYFEFTPVVLQVRGTASLEYCSVNGNRNETPVGTVAISLCIQTVISGFRKSFLPVTEIVGLIFGNIIGDDCDTVVPLTGYEGLSHGSELGNVSDAGQLQLLAIGGDERGRVVVHSNFRMIGESLANHDPSRLFGGERKSDLSNKIAGNQDNITRG